MKDLPYLTIVYVVMNECCPLEFGSFLKRKLEGESILGDWRLKGAERRGSSGNCSWNTLYERNILFKYMACMHIYLSMYMLQPSV